MGFFSELKSDLSQAVNTLMPEDKPDEAAGLDNENGASDKSAKEADREKVDISSMLDRIDDIKLDEADSKEETEEAGETTEAYEDAVEVKEPEETRGEVFEPETASVDEEVSELEQKIEEQTAAEVTHNGK